MALTIAELQVVIDANMKPLMDAEKLALLSTKKLERQLTKSANNIKGAFAGGIAPAMNKSAGAIKLNNQQLMNMQFQMNDMAVMLASGQSPFVLFTQQGMQISQMFKPGSPFQSVLKAIGSGFMTFVTNPLNLAVLGFAAAAGAVKLLFDSMGGASAKTAQESIKEFDDLAKDIGNSFKDAETRLKGFIDLANENRLDFMVRVSESASDLAVNLRGAEEVARVLINNLPDVLSFKGVKDGAEEVRLLADGMRNGTVETREMLDALNKIFLDDQTSAEVRKIVKNVIDATREMLNLEVRVNAAEDAITELGTSAIITASQVKAIFSAFDAFPEQQGLSNLLQGPIDALEEIKRLTPQVATTQQRLAEQLAIALKSPSEIVRREAQANYDIAIKNLAILESRKGARGRADELAQRAQYLSDLQREVSILSMRSDLQADATKQWEREKELRAAIADLGPNATASEINLVKELIPLRQQLTDELEKQLALQQEQEKLYGDLGGVAGNALQDIISGAKSAEEALLRMVVQMAAAILKAQVLAAVKGQGTNGQFFNSLIGGILSGVRANGGPVSGGNSYLVGERGPEIFTPSAGGMVIPNNKIGSSGASNDNSVVNISVDARGAQKGVGAEIASALKDYDRNKLPGRVRQIGRNKHAVG